MKFDLKILQAHSYSDKIVERYLTTLSTNTFYNVYSINDNLEIINVLGIIRSDESYNYHNNFDDSKMCMYIAKNLREPTNVLDNLELRWFSLKKGDAEKLQQDLIVANSQSIEDYINQLQKLKKLVQ